MGPKRPLTALFITAILYLALFYTVPHIPINKKSGLSVLIGLVLTTFVFMGIQISLVRWLAETAPKARTSALLLVISVALFIAGFILIATHQHDRLLNLVKDPKLLSDLRGLKPGVSAYSSLYTTYKGPLIPIMNLLVVASASLLGYLFSFLLREKNIILPVAAFAGFVDFWTVSFGPTSKMVSNAPQVVQAVSAQIPKLGAGHISPVSFIGPGDFVFLAILFGAICRHGMNARRTFWFIYPILAIGMLCVILGGRLLGLESGLPALVLVALGVVLANLGQFNLSRSEMKAVGVVALVLLGIVLIATILLTGRQ